MTVSSHRSTLCQKKVIEFPSDKPQNPADIIYRIRIDWDDEITWLEKFTQFLALPNIEKTTGLVVGSWETEYPQGPPDQVIQALVASREQLPHLEILFLGDITCEENEISWIENTDVSPLLTAFPTLKYFGVRGADGLSLGGLNHENLETLVIETGGLPGRVLREVINGHLPNLKHLELWLGDENYGFNFGIEDLQPIFEGQNFPNLTTLALKDSEIADEIAKAIVNAPILDQLEVLDLSMGTLGDEGAEALVQSERVKKLKALNLSHHYCSDEMMNKLASLPIEVDLSDQEAEDVYEYNGKTHHERYVAVSE
jgi:hypothetical protein